MRKCFSVRVEVPMPPRPTKVCHAVSFGALEIEEKMRERPKYGIRQRRVQASTEARQKDAFKQVAPPKKQ